MLRTQISITGQSGVSGFYYSLPGQSCSNVDFTAFSLHWLFALKYLYALSDFKDARSVSFRSELFTSYI